MLKNDLQGLKKDGGYYLNSLNNNIRYRVFNDDDSLLANVSLSDIDDILDKEGVLTDTENTYNIHLPTNELNLLSIAKSNVWYKHIDIGGL